jgi:hypothetical protein
MLLCVKLTFLLITPNGLILNVSVRKRQTQLTIKISQIRAKSVLFRFVSSAF